MVEQVGLLDSVDRPARRAGQVVVVCGTRPGVGKTTVAVNLALALVGGEARVALVDLDLRLGNLAPLLGVKTGGDVLSALAPGVLDDLGRLRAQLAWGPSGVDVLPAPPPDDRRPLDPVRVGRLLAALSELYDYVIVDTGPGADEVNRTAFSAAARVLLVVTPELATLEAEPGLPRDRVEVVLNRVPARASNRTEATSSFGLPIAWRLGEDTMADDVRPIARSLTGAPPEVRLPDRREQMAADARRRLQGGVGAVRAILRPRVVVPAAAIALLIGGAWFATRPDASGQSLLTSLMSSQPGPSAATPTDAVARAQRTDAPAPATPTAAPPTAVPTAPPATPPPATATRPAATATAAPATPTAAPPTATAAPPSPTARPLSFRTVLEERFADNRRGWPSRSSSNAWQADGAYNMFARQPGRFVAVRAPLSAKIRDGAVSATFRKVDGPVGGGYGLIVRDQGSSAGDGLDQSGRYYVFEVGDRGEVGAWRRDGDRWVDLQPWTRSSAVRAGTEPNTLTVRAVGSKLTFLVGDQQVMAIEDGTLREGAVGAFVGGDLNQVQMERFVVQEAE
jgi:hypothetical protein